MSQRPSKHPYHHRKSKTLQTRGDGGELHVRQAPRVSVTFRRTERLPPSKTATARMKDGEEEEEGWWWSASRSQRPCGLFICCCLHRKWGCSEAPLTRSFYYHSEAAIAAQLRASRFTHKSAKRSAADANRDGGRKKQPKELRQARAGGLNVTSALTNSPLGQTEVIQKISKQSVSVDPPHLWPPPPNTQATSLPLPS